MTAKKLTARQKEIVERVALGWSNKDIATDLQIEPRTVTVHLQNIYPILGVHNRYEVIAKHKKSDDAADEISRPM